MSNCACATNVVRAFSALWGVEGTRQLVPHYTKSFLVIDCDIHANNMVLQSTRRLHEARGVHTIISSYHRIVALLNARLTSLCSGTRCRTNICRQTLQHEGREMHGILETLMVLVHSDSIMHNKIQANEHCRQPGGTVLSNQENGMKTMEAYLNRLVIQYPKYS